MCKFFSVASLGLQLVLLTFVSAAFQLNTAIAEDAASPVKKFDKPFTRYLEHWPHTTLTRRSSPSKPLNARDQRAALEAIHFALREVADGSVFVWRRQTGTLKGLVKPTASFRDAEGAVCRHIIFSLSHAEITREIETIACRQDDGSWTLSG